MTLHRGERGRFFWLVSDGRLPSLPELAIRYHVGLRLCITSFDSTSISPTPEESAAGWTSVGPAMVSAPLTDRMEIPYDRYDEWYFVDQPPPAAWTSEVFVNYLAFTLAPSAQNCEYDWLAPMQERFWEQLDRINPVSYVAMGDNDIVVSKRREFIEAFTPS